MSALAFTLVAVFVLLVVIVLVDVHVARSGEHSLVRIADHRITVHQNAVAETYGDTTAIARLGKANVTTTKGSDLYPAIAAHAQRRRSLYRRWLGRITNVTIGCDVEDATFLLNDLQGEGIPGSTTIWDLGFAPESVGFMLPPPEKDDAT